MAGVTIYPAGHQAESLNLDNYKRLEAETEEQYLNLIESKKRGQILESSYKDINREYLFPSSNGVVWAAISAYNNHHHLKIRPDDIWLAILTQLSSYINAHSEELRGSFVAHEGKKKLEIVYPVATRFTVDWGEFASKMTLLMHEHVVDPQLRDWVLPAFSTTTTHDEIVASVIMMASLQKYFDFSAKCMCGLPSVTLLGEKSDYELILHRLDKLRSYGEEPTQFANMLTAVIKRFTQSFDDPKGAEVIDFWNRILSSWHIGSGMDYYSGWITAFMFWNKDGKSNYIPYREKKINHLTLDGVTFGVVDMDDVPRGYCEVPVSIDDNGTQIKAEMMAGSIGMEWTSRDGANPKDKDKLDTVQPSSGWFIYEQPEEDSPEQDLPPSTGQSLFAGTGGSLFGNTSQTAIVEPVPSLFGKR